MNDSIINKVEKAGLITLDLASIVKRGKRVELDLVDWLDNELIIKEASFRQKLKMFKWEDLKNCYVYVVCSKDVIIPPWTFLLIQMNLRNIAKQVFFCSKNSMNLLLFEQALCELDIEQFKNKRVFLKGCSEEDVPLGFWSLCVTKLTPHVKSLFYGEPCSNVLLIKN